MNKIQKNIYIAGFGLFSLVIGIILLEVTRITTLVLYPVAGVGLIIYSVIMLIINREPKNEKILKKVSEKSWRLILTCRILSVFTLLILIILIIILRNDNRFEYCVIATIIFIFSLVINILLFLINKKDS